MPLFQSQPVGVPGLIAITAGGLAFFASVLATRLGSRSSAPAKRKSGLSTLGVLIQMLAFAGTGVGRILVAMPADSPGALAVGAAVALLMLASVALFWAASRAMGANWSVVARMREGHELVTQGIFARLRHPIYTGMGAFLIALAIAFGHPASLLVTAPLFALGTAIRIREEEKLLRVEFGAAYDAYAARVKRFVPGLI
ncbi:MAG TPA: isoprenylcysteine carboxylmethyltransferase family protein [Allosphingosinicella sp.]|nr:isoprenylcysteine carboxylmethyltransferase family protein [Allosphingosinicella sp.]